MLAFVVPQFESLFNDMGEALPALTRRDRQRGLFAGLVLAVAGGRRAFFLAARWLNSEAGARLARPRCCACRWRGTSSSSSRWRASPAPWVRCWAMACPCSAPSTSGSKPSATWCCARASTLLPPAVKAGQRMSVALAETRMFTPMVIQMTRVGEESGALDAMMLELAKVFDDHVSSGVSSAA
jgi:general secretion pathway protein F